MRVTPALRALFKSYANGADDTSPEFRVQLWATLAAHSLSKPLRTWMDAVMADVLD